MAYPTTTLESFLAALGLTRAQVIDRTGRGMMSYLPAPLFDFGLWLGLGQFIIDAPQNQRIAANIGVPPQMLTQVAQRLRSRAQWRPLWEGLAAALLGSLPLITERGEKNLAVEQLSLAIILLNLAYGGDGDFIHTSMREYHEVHPRFLALYQKLYDLQGALVEPIEIPHARGTTFGLLHLPHSGAPPFPTLLALPPLASNKEFFDFSLAPFRAAGYATICFDLPAHGETFGKTNLKYDDEIIFAEVLQVLATHPKVAAHRIAIMGGSMGGFFALRTAAVSEIPKVCVAFASPFDIGFGLPNVVPGIFDHFQTAVGTATRAETLEVSKKFTLDQLVGKIRCPILLVHGTQDHVCDFTVPYEIARRAKAPLKIVPVPEADHEISTPRTPRLAQPALEWLKVNL